MEKIDFYTCSTLVGPVEWFGICDKQEQQPAFIDSELPDSWNAKVNNAVQKELWFLAVDNNPDIPIEGSKCDALLYAKDGSGIYFIELKYDRTAGWISKAIDQLKQTVLLFGNCHTLSVYRHRSAHVCNRKKPQFAYGHTQQMQEFKNETTVTLVIQHEITIRK